MGTIKTSGYAEKKYLAEMIEYSISFYSRAESARIAMDIIKSEEEQFLKELDAFGVDLKNVHLEEDFVRETYEMDKILQEARRRITFKLPYNSAVNEQILFIIKQLDGKADYNISFSLNNVQEKKKELLGMAVRESKDRAEAIADACGQKVIGIENIQDNNYPDSVADAPAMPLARFESFAMAKNTGFAEQISAREISLSETVYISWIIG